MSQTYSSSNTSSVRSVDIGIDIIRKKEKKPSIQSNKALTIDNSIQQGKVCFVEICFTLNEHVLIFI